MNLTPRLIAILGALRRYWYLRTAQIRDLLLPADKDGSVTRECLRQLLRLGLVRRHEPRLLEFGKTTAPPIFVLTVAGSLALARETGTMSAVLAAEPTFKDWMSLSHYCSLASFHMTIDQALAQQSRARLTALYFEHEVVCPESSDPARRYRLFTRIDEKVCCCPDSAMETELDGYRRAWFIEHEMGSDAPARAAAKKCKGFHGLHTRQLYKEIFPQARDFRVIAVCPHAAWRDALRRAMADKPGAELWLFCDVNELTVEKVLGQPLLYGAESGPYPLLPG